MKLLKLTMFSIVLSLFSTNTFSQGNSGPAPNVTLTDVNGVSYNVYDLINQGYKVILDFSYELCGPCRAWAQHVGHDLWDEHGPNGDNTIRMFHIDVDPESDADVIAYTTSWGVTYPVININGVMPEYSSMVTGYPTLIYICEDYSYFEDGGYGYPYAKIEADVGVNLYCEGIDVDNDYYMYGLTSDPSFCALNANAYNYTPRLMVVRSALDNTIYIDQVFQVETFINNVSIGTQSVDPWDAGSVGTKFQEVTLADMAVSPGDVVRFEMDYPGDSYAGNNSTEITIPTVPTSPTITSNTIHFNSGDPASFYEFYDWNGNYLQSQQGSGSFTLPNGTCYYVEIYNIYYGVQIYGGNGTQIADILPSNLGEEPRVYFNVNNGGITGIERNQCRKGS